MQRDCERKRCDSRKKVHKMLYDAQVEKAVLFAIIFEGAELNIQEKDFVDIKNKEIAKAILELKKNKEDISLLSVQEITKGNKEKIIDYISHLGDNVFGITGEYSLKKLKEYTKKRELKEEAEKILKEISDEENINEYAEKEIKAIQEIAKEGITEKEDLLTKVAKTTALIEEAYLQQADYSLYTGIFDLDKLTGGLHKKEFTVIGARPGVGKTTFALQVASRIAEKGIEVAIFSLEMSDTQIITKMISKKTEIDNDKIKFGTLEEEDFNKIAEASSKISELPLSIITECYTLQDIEIELRRLKNNKNLGLAVIDYLQLIKNNNKKYNNREQELADISRTLKLLSLELDIPIIALCQLNRNASRTEPTLADIRESGAIEQDADNVIFLYKQNSDEDNPVQDIVVDLQKQRNGCTGTLNLRFVKRLSEFRNLVK